MFVALLLLGRVNHVPEITETKVDMIEVNHSFCNKVDQVIFWEWSEGRWKVRGWRMVAKCALPVPDGRGWRVTWMDKGKLRTVYSRIAIHSQTNRDPEIENRQIVPVEKRTPL